MAVKATKSKTSEKSVAGAQAQAEASIPETASLANELEASEPVTAQLGADENSAPSEAVLDSRALHAAEARKIALAKARAVKAAKKAAEAAAKKAEVEAEISSIQSTLAAEAKADRHSFGEIREVARVAPTAEEYIRVEIPLTDLFDHGHPGVQLNRHKFEPGKTYLLRGDVALEVKRRLAMFHDEQVRLLRPNADRKALNDVNRGSQWTSRGGNSIVPLGRLEDVAIASDEKIYTVDF